VRCFLLWAREQGRIAADRDVIRVILQGWNSRLKGPPLPGGPGKGLAAGDVGTAGREKSSPAGAVRLSWGAAADAFLLVSRYTVLTRTAYKRHLRYAGELLGDVPLAELTVERLDAQRAAVLAGHRRGIRC
jgi:hypothetical protein